MRKITYKLMVMLLVLLGFNSVSYADTLQENQDLARVSNILNAVYPLIDKAQAQAEPNQRVSFRYDWLKKDVQAIQAGIAQKINAAPIQPRVVKSLKTEYIAKPTTER
tara:strand:- start:61249 stop:61572 length:324 start_codon:yes stop_codon:yes gene_type:complete